MSQLQIISCTILLLGFCLIGGLSQSLNNHINPAWVESGRQLMARQGYRVGQQSYRQLPFAGRDGLQGYNSAQSSLFYLDNAGQLRPVFIDPSATPLTQPTSYRNQGGNIGINSRSELYQTEPYYI